MTFRQYELGTAELEVLNLLWDHGACTVRQVLEQLHGKDRHIAYTTALTMLTRLEQKGVVTSDKRGIAYVYRAAVSRERMQKSRLRTLVEQMYDGAAAPLVLQLIKTQRFSKDEIEVLQKLINDLDREST